MSDQDRIDQLAAQVRRLRFVTYGMAQVIAAGVIFAAVLGLPLVKTKRIEIVADNGKTALALDSDGIGGGQLTTYDKNGRTVVWLGADHVRGGGGLRTFDGNRQVVVELGANSDGDGTLSTFNTEGYELVRLGAANNRYGQLSTYNPRGYEAVQITATMYGGYLTINDSVGKSIVDLGTENRGGAVRTYNSEGRRLVHLGTITGDSGIVATDNGTGGIRLLD